jgi:4-hydroxythreonine-4-phosphate dehydrogenase
MLIPRIALCSGEPAGIGPDLALMLAETGLDAEVITLGCPTLLRQRAEQLGLTINFINYDSSVAASANKKGEVKVLALATAVPVTTGLLNPKNARYVLDILDCAIAGCLAGTFDAMLTCPVQKSVINQAGIAFSGHTEYLAEKTHSPQVVMMLASDEMRVSLATTHLPLRDVADAITGDLLESIIRIINSDLEKYFGISQPHILVAGLNPHAGESGHLGREEIDIIIPCLEKLRQQGFKLSGPLPADTLFTEKYLSNCDAVLAMYHDQGLPVLKYQGFSKSCNITLGLPIVRTSVDHGTALDLAGSGNIHTGSLFTALNNAITMASMAKKS